MESVLTSQQRQQLLALARSVIEQQVQNGRSQPSACPDPALAVPRGCFVTIKQHRQLRGCIGNFRSELPLWRNVAQMAVAAATGDPRFYPMKSPDLTDYTLEISVLSPLRRIADIGEIEVGRHGLYLEKGPYHGVLLPQVASEYGWDRADFLRHTCLKAGLPADAWQSAKCVISIFSAEVFGEESVC